MDIDPSTTEPELASLKENLAYTELEMNRLQSTVQKGGFRRSNNENEGAFRTQQAVYQASLTALSQKLNAKQQQLNSLDAQLTRLNIQSEQTQNDLSVAQDKLTRMEAVEDILAKNDIEAARLEVTSARNKLLELDEEKQKAHFEKSQTHNEIATIQADFNTQNLESLATKQKSAIELDARIQQNEFRTARLQVRSPVSGTVNELQVHTVGGVVTPAQPLMTILPDNAPLIIKAQVLNKDIGFVKPGMTVSIKVDTFEFQKYGTLEGIVKQVATDAHTDEKMGPIFDVLVTPSKTSFQVNGHTEPIHSGMSVSAEIKTGKRRIIEFFIYPMIKYWNEGVSVR